MELLLSHLKMNGSLHIFTYMYCKNRIRCIKTKLKLYICPNLINRTLNLSTLRDKLYVLYISNDRSSEQSATTDKGNS